MMQGVSRGDQSALRRRNEARFIEVLRDHGFERAHDFRDSSFPGLERATLARLAGLSRPTVSNLTDRFRRFVDGARPAGPGAAQTTLALRPEAGCAIGVDIGPAHDRVAIGDIQGQLFRADPEIYERTKRPGVPPADSLDWVTDRVRRLLDDIGATPDDVVGVGISLAGPIERDSGLTHPSGLLDPVWRDLNVARELERRLGWQSIDFRTDNDANLSALTQHIWGAARGLRNVLYVKWSDGIGMGLIVDDEVYRGHRGFAGEGGHIVVDPDSEERCPRCGRFGCLEVIAAPHNILTKIGVSTIGGTPAEQLVDLAGRGSGAQNELEDAARAVGRVVAGVMNVMEPEAVVLGGSIGVQGFEVIAPPIRESVDRYAMGFASEIKLTRGHQFGRAAVRGAVALALRENLVRFLTEKPMQQQPKPKPKQPKKTAQGSQRSRKKRAA